MQNPKPTKPYELFEPVKVFIALMIAVLFYLIPIAYPVQKEEMISGEISSVHTLFATSADACPFNCIKCLTYDPNVWPRDCLTWYCDAQCEEQPGGGGPNYSPPTIAHTLNCAQSGLNNWCIGALSIDLNASDPQGQSIIISGDVNGQTFTCTTNPCTLNLPEGIGAINYKADSATGLSASGSTAYYLDVTTPQISGSVNGSTGNSGWYITQAVASASASDQVSGLASFEASIDGSPFNNFQSPISFNDGIHSVQFRAVDNAGNVTETAVHEIKVDTVAPALNIAATGSTGSNGWYISAVTLTPTVNDSGSGVATLEATTDGVAWFNVNTPITLIDGIYTVQFRATDQAGNVSQTAVQQIKVDATTPSLSLNISGTRGQNDWYTSATSVTPNASDAGSGINTIEAKINGSAWVVINSPLFFIDGVHSYAIRVTDNAGNVTETPVLPMRVDTVPPAIAMDNDTLSLGDTLKYDLEDSLSGLWISRSVIEDDAEQYKKIVWVEEVTGLKSNNHTIRWDGVFADGTKAVPGQYFITLKISDQAGNETIRTAIVEVTSFNLIVPIPAFVPPVTVVTESQPVEPAIALEASFGGGDNGVVSTETTITSGEAIFTGAAIRAGGSNFTVGSQTNVSQSKTTSNVLWGGAAAALLGMTLAEWQRRRQEEEARRRAQQVSEEEEYDDGAAKRRAKVMAKNQAKRAQEQVWERARTTQTGNAVKDEETFMRQTYKKVLNTANVIPGISSWKKQEEAKAKEQAKQNAVSAARWEGVASVAQKKAEPSKWEQLVNWVDQHQPLAAIGIGGTIGLIAIAAVLAMGMTITLPVILGTAAIAAVVTAMVVSSGTIALNNYYDRSPGTNVISNMLWGGGAAFITAALGLSAIYLATNLVALAGPAITSTCAVNPNLCSQIGPAIDMVEQGALAVQFGVQTALGDPNAPLTYAEWQLELSDGGVPGNLILGETAEQLAKLSPRALELVVKYGDEVIPFLFKYGDDGVDIIERYGRPAADLIIKHGDTAIDVLQGNVAKVDNVVEFVADVKGVLPDARMWYSPSSGRVYYSNSSQQALDASKQLAEVVSNGGDIENLIFEIAEESTHGSGDRVVLGIYDQTGGYIGDAIENGGIFFDMGNDLWEIIKAEIDDPWLVNEEFLRQQMSSGVASIEFVGVDVDVFLDPTVDWGDRIPYRVLEARFVNENAEKFGYVRVGNTWVRP